MVTADTEAKFAEKGVLLVSAQTGRRLFKDVLARAESSPVEIICGEGPWEQREANNGQITRTASAPARQASAALLGNAVITTLPKGEQVVAVCFDENHAYLQDHRIDGVPVLPAAVALEIMAQAACSLWDGWKVVEVRDCRLMKGVELSQLGHKVCVTINPPPYGSSEGFEVNATLHSESDKAKPLIHYRCVVRLEPTLPADYQQATRLHSEKKLAVSHAYDNWLFHGPRFQVIESIDGLSNTGAAAQVRSTRPANWLVNTAPEHNQWLFDPALVDAAAQMAILWARSFRDETPLPTRFGRVVRYREQLPERLHMAFEYMPTDNPSLVRANVHFSDADGRVVLLIEDMECIASAALNRLGGSARTVTEAVM